MPELIVRLKDREIQRLPVVAVTTRIGRDPTNELVIDNESVSRLHATIRYDGSAFVVHDEGSANGLFINGRTARTLRLNDGDEIQVGKFTVVFAEAGGVDPAELRPEGLASERPPPRSHNPVPTTALRSDEVQKLLHDKTARAEAERQDLERRARTLRVLTVALGLLAGALLAVTAVLLLR